MNAGSQAEPLVPTAAALAFFAVLDEAICEAGRVFNSSSDDGGRRVAAGQCAGLSAAHMLMQDLSDLRCEVDGDGLPTGRYVAAAR